MNCLQCFLNLMLSLFKWNIDEIYSKQTEILMKIQTFLQIFKSLMKKISKIKVPNFCPIFANIKRNLRFLERNPQASPRRIQSLASGFWFFVTSTFGNTAMLSTYLTSMIYPTASTLSYTVRVPVKQVRLPIFAYTCFLHSCLSLDYISRNPWNFLYATACKGSVCTQLINCIKRLAKQLTRI